MAAGPVLRDIHMPPDPSWWPLAPGWWGVIALLLVALTLVIWWTWRRRLPRRRWRHAERELERLLARHGEEPSVFAAAVSQLLRRVAREREPDTVSLRGEAWQAALQRLAGKHVNAAPLANLERVMYRPGIDLDTETVANTARQWLRRVMLHGGRRA